MEIGPELAEMRAGLRRFAERELVPFARLMDQGGDYPPGLAEALARQRILGLRLAEEHGGAGMGLAEYCLVQEELARCHPILPVLVASSSGLTPMAIQRHGTPAQRARYLPKLPRGESRTAFALSEPEAGSDAAAIRTRAVPDGKGWRLSGAKQFISNADVADLFLILAVTDPARRGRGRVTGFLVERGTPGLHVGRVDRTMGTDAWTVAEVTLDDCRLGADAVLGEVGQGMTLALESLAEGRLGVASICLGTADRMLELSIARAKSRTTFGAPLAERQAIQWMLADSATEVMAARAMLYETIRAGARGEPIAVASSMCKLHCSEMAGRVADRAVQIHGAMGVMRGQEVERAFRDMRLFRIGEGSSEVQRMVIARGLLA
ncbi:acyl-CoA dehydrogenase family protein [Falsiroseomonas sp. CW058]|uniref:acyl-CoA dehydrogenase family protein n=1 Tax=Falsiroseomonas sp. CW058 TaxID=3388664 RepID=UPI003D3180ED